MYTAHAKIISENEVSIISHSLNNSLILFMLILSCNILHEVYFSLKNLNIDPNVLNNLLNLPWM